MVKVIEGNLIAKGKKFGIIASRFNDFMTKELVNGCADTLLRHGTQENDIAIFWVPGAFEIPVVAHRLAEEKSFDALICLGTIIRGATPHFEYIASECAKGIARISQQAGLPVTFGIITADSIEQAIERAGSKEGNKGRQAALNAIEMVNLLTQIK